MSTYKGPGMWMPRRKDGKSWQVTYTVKFADGGAVTRVRKFRTRDDAREFVAAAKNTVTRSTYADQFAYSTTQINRED